MGPLAKSAEIAVDVTGAMHSPSADGRVAVHGIGGGSSGIPAVDDLQTGFHLRDGTLTVDGLHAGVAGGSLDGGGSARLFERSMAHMLDSPVIDFRLDGKSLSLEELIVSGIVSGRVSFDLTATGTAKNPKVHFRVPGGTTVVVLGQSWLLEGIEIEAGKDALTVRLCHVAGKSGGDIRIEGHADLTKKPLAIDWRIKILDLPIAAILAAAKVDAPVSGNLSLDLHVAGTVDGGVAVAGTLFDRLHLGATAAYGAKGIRAHATLAFENLRVEEVVPDLKEQGIAATLSGQIGVDIQPGHLPAIDVLISQIDASLTRDMEQQGGGKTTERIWLKNASPLHIVTDTEKVVVDQARR